MKRFREPKWMLILLFLGLIAVLPLVQIATEVGSDDGVLALDVFSEWPTAQNLRSYEHKLEKANWAARLSRPWLQFGQFAGLKEGGEKVIVGSQGWYFFKPGLKYMLARPDVAHLSTNDAIGAIVHFRDQLAAHGVHLLVIPIPNKESIYPELLTSRAKTPQGILASRTRQVLEQMRANGIETLDLFKEFNDARQRGSTNEPLYLAQDTHWSPAGVALAAKLAARRLVELGWIQPGTSEYRERPAPVQRLGDILRMLQTPLIDRRVAPENVSASQVIRALDSKPYADEATAEVLVLGDSFMRIYQTDTPTSAGFISHLAKEIKQPMMSLVNDGGGSTLVREELSLRPIFLNNKKVVVWEFVERDIGIGVKGWLRTSLPPPPAKASVAPNPI